jgi:hypothetical protein
MQDKTNPEISQFTKIINNQYNTITYYIRNTRHWRVYRRYGTY